VLAAQGKLVEADALQKEPSPREPAQKEGK
jgi:hypothetical protein